VPFGKITTTEGETTKPIVTNDNLTEMKKSRILLITATIVLLVIMVIVFPQESPREFDGARALEKVNWQVAQGARIPGSQAHERVLQWIESDLRKSRWEVEIQHDNSNPQLPIKNIIARRDAGRPWIILGAHYDTRPVADRDPNPQNRLQPVPGANDGASGVAILLELGRVLPRKMDKSIWLVFFDAEDGGGLPGGEWILGSTYFASQLESYPDAVVIVDMVGDSDLNLYYERNSSLELSQSIWNQAAALGYNQFIPAPKYSILDDHTPFLERGIPAVDIIDFDYPYWHTLEDTPDKVSAESLEAVGKTLQYWLLAYAGQK